MKTAVEGVKTPEDLEMPSDFILANMNTRQFIIWPAVSRPGCPDDTPELAGGVLPFLFSDWYDFPFMGTWRGHDIRVLWKDSSEQMVTLRLFPSLVDRIDALTPGGAARCRSHTIMGTWRGHDIRVLWKDPSELSGLYGDIAQGWQDITEGVGRAYFDFVDR